MPVLNVIRRRASTLAVKYEATPGVDAFAGAAPSAATDFLKADVGVTFNQTQVTNSENTYALETAAPIPGGTKVQITVTVMLKGSGAAGVAPQWGKLMNLCSWQEVLNPAPVAAQLATAGGTNHATLGAGFSAVAGAYQGMPAVLTGNPAGPFTTLIAQYSAARVATFVHNFPVALDGTTSVAIPANVLYRPVTDPALMQNGTLNCYMDGLLWKFTGCAGTWKLDMPAGGAGTLVFTLTGQYNEPVAAAAPAGIVFDAVTPPVFRQGIARSGGNLIRVSKISFDGGSKLYEPENPEAGEGFDPSIITSRDVKGTIDPLMSVADTIARMAAFKVGSQQSVAVAVGTVPGNIIGLVAPTTQFTGETPTNRNDLMAETIPFACPGPNSSLYLTVA